jgi:hypothetical protein
MLIPTVTSPAQRAIGNLGAIPIWALVIGILVRYGPTRFTAERATSGGIHDGPAAAEAQR